MLVELISGDASFARITREAGYVGRHRSAPALVPDGGRFVKSHEPYVSRYRRAILLVRDPRDVAPSYFRFLQRNGEIRVRPGDDLDASFDRFVRALLAGRFAPYATWQAHLFSWLEASDAGRADVMPIRYEDMRADAPHELMRIVRWLGLKMTGDEAALAAERCSLERMRVSEKAELAAKDSVFPAAARRSGLPFVNEGLVGGWRGVLTAEQRRLFLEKFELGLRAMGYPLD